MVIQVTTNSNSQISTSLSNSHLTRLNTSAAAVMLTQKLLRELRAADCEPMFCPPCIGRQFRLRIVICSPA